MATILVLHGPNMGLKGREQIDQALEARAEALSVELTVVQSNAEATLVDHLSERRYEVDGLIINPGVLAPSAWVLAEALGLVAKPAVEVLLAALPAERGPSALAGHVAQQIHGRGADGYLEALEAVVKLLPAEAREPQAETPAEEDADAAQVAASPGRRQKTIGRRPPPPAAEAAGQTAKTIGPRQPGQAAAPASAPTTAGGRLSKGQVREKLKARLSGTLSAEALASWARTEWSALQKGGPVEDGARELLDGMLLTLMAGAKASDHILLAQLAKLER